MQYRKRKLSESCEHSIQNSGKGEENTIEENGGGGQNAETEHEVKWKNKGTEENKIGNIDDPWNGEESDNDSVNGQKGEVVNNLENRNVRESSERGDSGTTNEETKKGSGRNEGTENAGERRNEGTNNCSGERNEGAKNGNKVGNEGMETGSGAGYIGGAGVGGEAENGDESNSMDGG